MVKGTYGTMYMVRDMKKSVQYYKEQIGLTPTFESDGWTEFKLDGHSLCLHIGSPEKNSDQGGVLITRVEGINEMVESMKSKGVEFLSDVHEVHPGAVAIDFKDPDGNIVSFYEEK